MLRKIWLAPPLAFARLGSAARPCQAFSWAPNQIGPSDSEKTRLSAEDTYTLDAQGAVTVTPASSFDVIEFKDEQGRFLPVCPFFELHGDWDEDGNLRSGPLTMAVLEQFGPKLEGESIKLADIQWEVAIANLKAYHYTLNDGDRLEARVTLTGDQTRRVVLEGRTPQSVNAVAITEVPMIGPDRHIPMGAVQVAQPSRDAPELRLRFYAPEGLVYGSDDLGSRELEGSWTGFRLPGREIVNAASSWARLNFDELMLPPLPYPDGRNNPGGLAAADARGVSLGLVDDVSDGLVSCTIPGFPPAVARIAVGPPDFAPNARPIVSIQDGLADRVDRDKMRNGEISDEELEALVHDIFERALETSDLMNKDAQSDRAHTENGEQLLPPPPTGYQDRAHGTMWPRPGTQTAADPRPDNVDALPISQEGQRRHRRLNALEYLRDRLREEPDYIENWVRPPIDPSRAYDRRMPPLMRNSDRYPMHLTRRQYELLLRWAAKVRQTED